MPKEMYGFRAIPIKYPYIIHRKRKMKQIKQSKIHKEPENTTNSQSNHEQNRTQERMLFQTSRYVVEL